MQVKCMMGTCERRRGDKTEGGREITFHRGLCNYCYGALLKIKKREGYSWDELVEAGICLKAYTERRNQVEDFVKTKLELFRKSKRASSLSRKVS